MSFDLNILSHSIESVLTFFLIGLLGYILAGRGWFTPEFKEALSRLITQVALPLYLIHNIYTSMTRNDLMSLAYGVIPPYLSIGLALLLSFAWTRLLGTPKERRGIFCIGVAFSNTMYIGLPVNLALFGGKAAPFVILYYFANTSLFWSVGNLLLAVDGDKTGHMAWNPGALKKMFPPAMFGFLFGLLLLLLDVRLPSFAANSLGYLGNVTTPLVMLLVGETLHEVGVARIRFDRDMILMFLGRFVASPLMIILIIKFFPLPELMNKVFIIQASLPMMATLPVLSAFHGADAEYATVAVSASTLAGLATIPLSMLVATAVV